MGKLYPKSTFCGLNLDEASIKFAKDKADTAGLKSVQYMPCDAPYNVPFEWKTNPIT